jgi:uncharacterized membrane protein (UPF0127 family)
MFKQIILPILGVVAFIVIVGIFVQKSSSISFRGFGTPQPTTIPSKTISIESKKIQVQIADTKDKRTNGLSGVKSLGADSGMFFVFDTKSSPVFWMKDMFIPIDIIWIANEKIVRIDKNVSIPDSETPDVKLKTYSTGAPVDYVLEVNAGFSDANSIKVGSTVDLSGI